MIYHIYANQSNIGDWLSAKGIQKLLGDREITECFCDEPFVGETMEVLKNATKDDLIVIGGGGLLMDYFIPFWQAFQSIAERIPFVIWGIGYCDIKHELSLPPNKLIEQIVNKARLCIVRDELSRSYLPYASLPDPIPCPSLNIVTMVIELGKDILHAVNYTTVTPGAYEIMCDITKGYAQENDITYRETNNLVSKGGEAEMENILSIYRQSKIVVSSALHGCIIAVAMGLKVIAVSGDRKIDEFMKAVGLGEWVLNYNEAHLLNEKLQIVDKQFLDFNLLESISKQNWEIGRTIRGII